jgi:hypothetical protein
LLHPSDLSLNLGVDLCLCEDEEPVGLFVGHKGEHIEEAVLRRLRLHNPEVRPVQPLRVDRERHLVRTGDHEIHTRVVAHSRNIAEWWNDGLSDAGYAIEFKRDGLTTACS